MKKSKKKVLRTTDGKITLNIKIPEKEANAFRLKASRFANGNFTQMARLAIHAWTPKKAVEGVRKTTRT